MIYTPYLLRTWTSINREVRSKTTFISWQPMSPVGNVPTAKCACRIDNYVVKCDGRTFSIELKCKVTTSGEATSTFDTCRPSPSSSARTVLSSVTETLVIGSPFSCTNSPFGRGSRGPRRTTGAPQRASSEDSG